MKVTVTTLRGARMEAEAQVFEPRNWLYLNFHRGKICIDLSSGKIVKKQTYRAPVLRPGELQRIVSMFRS